MLNTLKGKISEYSPYWTLFRFDMVEANLFATFPALASIAIAVDDMHRALLLFILAIIGSFAAKPAGCIVNDIFDRKIDIHVERTKNRPLASGRLTLFQALKALLFLCCIALVVLAFTNMLTFYLSIVCVVGAIIYPLMKRFISYPQFVLGPVFNLGVLMGSAMAANKITLGAALMYIGCIFWQIAYDTIYAHQDKIYDKALGLGSTAITFGGNTRMCVGVLYTLTSAMWISVGVVSSLGLGYYLFMLPIMGMFYHQYKNTDFDNPSVCMYMFKMNAYVGALLFVGALLGRMRF